MDITADDHALDAFSSDPIPPTTTDDTMLRALTIAALNHLLTHELMTAEACRSAANWFEHLPVSHLLRQVMDGHHQRAGVLYETIRALEGSPAVDPRRQETANAPATLQMPVVLALLLDLEKRGVAAYRTSLDQLDGGTRTLVEAELLPGQETALGTIAGAQPPPADGAV